MWSKKDEDWFPRCHLSKPSIGRLTYVHPGSGDLFYQRLLLCHQKGCTSFLGIRTVDNHTYATNREAAEALGLLENDGEWVTALQEAAVTASAAELRTLFVQILLYCEVGSPTVLWDTFWEHMSDDIQRILSALHGVNFLHVSDEELKGGVLYELEASLNEYGRSLSEFGLPLPAENLLEILTNRLLMEEKNYDRHELAKEKELLIPKLNSEQRKVFDIIIQATKTLSQELVFVYGHGGTGKTFLWKTIITTLRSEGKIVLAVASSGIASLLLPSGRTAHSRFKLPLELTDESVCMIKKNTQLAKLLMQTDLIVWDEAPMNDRKCFEAVDRTLRDLFDSPTEVFGGKTVMIGGDFRQTLPVKKKASMSEIIASCISESYLWSHFQVFFLEQNMRLQKECLTNEDRQQLSIFSEWLLNIGNGEIGCPDIEDPENTSWVRIPDTYCFPPNDEGKWKLIDFIYDATTLKNPTAESFQYKAIVCPKNEIADSINAQVLQKVSGVSHFYTNFDQAIPRNNDGGASELLYPVEYLNSLCLAGLPPHKLELKIGTPIILIRNLNLAGGLCNGTRMIVTQLFTKVIEAKIITGTRIAQRVFFTKDSVNC